MQNYYLTIIGVILFIVFGTLFGNKSVVSAIDTTLITVEDSYYFYSANEIYTSLIYFSLTIAFIYFKSVTPLVGPFAVIIFLIISVFALVIFFIFTVILLLDQFYRPNIPQYPYNSFIDRIIPITLLISPAITIYFLSSYLNALFCIILLIALHSGVVIPMMHYWSQLRNWDVKITDGFVWSWDNPRLYKHLSIAFIYPLIWGFYFMALRYLRLGQEINYNIIYDLLGFDWFFILCILMLFYSIWLRLAIWSFLDLKNYLWGELFVLLYSLHLKLLQNNIYFYLMEKLYKLAYIWFSFVVQSTSLFGLRANNIIIKIYKYSNICNILVVFFVLFELLYTRGTLFFSLYLLFIYPILYIIFRFLVDLACFNWVEVVNASDYLARNFVKPHYPSEFWQEFNVTTYRGDFSWNFSDEELIVLQKLGEPYLNKRSYTFAYEYRLTQKVLNRQYCMRLKASYRFHSGVRWVHIPVIKTIPHALKNINIVKRRIPTEILWASFSTLVAIPCLAKTKSKDAILEFDIEVKESK